MFDMYKYIGHLLNPRGWAAIKVMIGSTYVNKIDGSQVAKLRGEGVQFNFKLCRRYNTCQIIYDRGLDLFDVVFFNQTAETIDVRTGKVKGGISNVRVFKDQYFEDLRPLFEQTTGLYLTL